MKLSRVIMSALVALALAPTVSFAAPGAAGGLVGTDHDFASAGGGNVAATAVGLCTFCHTPHKAISTSLLWNHTLSSNTFTWDIAKTTAGTEFPSIVGGTYKGPTAKCLSCHDGSVAIGDIAWFNEAAYPGGTGMQTTKITGSHQMATATGGMAGNHPVAMPYPYSNAANTYNGKTTGAGIVLTEWQADPTALSGTKIRLFNDDGSGIISAGVSGGKSGLECSSCHDPHNKATVDEMFLRGKLTGVSQSDGYICLQCHIK